MERYAVIRAITAPGDSERCCEQVRRHQSITVSSSQGAGPGRAARVNTMSGGTSLTPLIRPPPTGLRCECMGPASRVL